jgi:IS4 transposase
MNSKAFADAIAENPSVSISPEDSSYQCQPWPEKVNGDIKSLEQKLHELESRCRHLELIVHRMLNGSI